MNTVKKFNKDGYVFLKDFVNKDDCKKLAEELKKLVSENKTEKDVQCPSSQAIYGAVCFDTILNELLPYVELHSGKKLYPTYSYARLYAPGEILKNHRDRESCEISVSLTLDFEGTPWPIYMGNKKNKSNPSKIVMKPGDAVLYKGREKWHWREKYEGKWQAQVFLHYVDKDGPYADFRYDKRKSLNLSTQSEELVFAYYNDVLTPDDCDKLIALYTKDNIPKEKPYIGNEQHVNTNVRNVERVLLQTHRGLGSRLAAVGLDANFHRWKFDITHANQSEFLIYKEGGRYTPHVDTFIQPSSNETRKLTILAFLNDDFEGGKFFILNGHEKVYPPQTKGTVLVFPSFLLHGVEDVVSGTRCSAVAWMVGPWFK